MNMFEKLRASTNKLGESSDQGNPKISLVRGFPKFISTCIDVFKLYFIQNPSYIHYIIEITLYI